MGKKQTPTPVVGKETDINTALVQVKLATHQSVDNIIIELSNLKTYIKNLIGVIECQQAPLKK